MNQDSPQSHEHNLLLQKILDDRQQGQRLTVERLRQHVRDINEHYTHLYGDKMPVQTINRNGKLYYRWGNEGKEYPTRAEAERQGRAIEASKAQQMKKEKK